ncbi:hypothetical protein A9R00_03965 [Oleispira antarctica]|uniref:Type II secretion system protein GspB C-terminal domain-containing protein n=1 Tax=Oleispira antarctica TaxID=188908 RepID=A0A1Y5HU79_OLEAN|nr:hypothetical protein A9R00_03965 [Oleispira antarctica]
MSYILAALKKSEQEREQLEAAASSEQASMPVDFMGTASLPPASSAINLTSRSLIVSYALAVVVLSSLFAYLLVKPTPAPITAPTLHSAPAVLEQPIADDTAAEIPVVSEQEIKTVKVTKADAQIGTIAEVKVETEAVIEPKTVIEPEVVVETQPDIEVIGIEQASDSLLDQMPDLVITSHIYSSQAKRRSIVVNGERLAEGDFVVGQIQVKEITHQGMVLKVKNSLLAVNRSRGWNR